MLPTGDVQGCFRKLDTLLRFIKYPGHVDYNGLSKGDPSAFLPILSFSLTTFSPPFAEQLVAAGLVLTGKTDLRFTDTLYKVLRDVFNYKPVVSKQQFLQRGFVQRKISTLCDIIDLVLEKHRELKRSCTAKKREDYLEWPDYFMAVAFLSAQRSKDPSSQVGACLVNGENKIVGIGYNGMPNGCHDDQLPWARSADDRLDTKYPYVCHAELNAIMNKNSADVKGCTMYVALFPCNECAKLIIQAESRDCRVSEIASEWDDVPRFYCFQHSSKSPIFYNGVRQLAKVKTLLSQQHLETVIHAFFFISAGLL
ncbi:deoxycytidylate deaminase isoform X2 [Vanacampus margaritifer]